MTEATKSRPLANEAESSSLCVSLKSLVRSSIKLVLSLSIGSTDLLLILFSLDAGDINGLIVLFHYGWHIRNRCNHIDIDHNQRLRISRIVSNIGIKLFQLSLLITIFSLNIASAKSSFLAK